MVLMAIPVLALPIYFMYLNEKPGGAGGDAGSSGSNLAVPKVLPAQVDTSRNYFSIGVCMIPHRDKAYKGGEDAFSCSNDSCMFCLADGVGGWAKKGVDPGLYSRELCSQFKDMYEI